jgi:hypothetical protein
MIYSEIENKFDMGGNPPETVADRIIGKYHLDRNETSGLFIAQAQKIYDRGQWPKFYFTKQGKGGIRRKTFLENVGGKVVTNFWTYADTGHTDEAKKEMLAIFDGIATFDTPKPTRLIQRILEICPDKDAGGRLSHLRRHQHAQRGRNGRGKHPFQENTP